MPSGMESYEVSTLVVKKQESNSPCKKDRTFGIDEGTGMLWVIDGCRGVFEFCTDSFQDIGSPGKYYCTCPSGYYGVNCENNIFTTTTESDNGVTVTTEATTTAAPFDGEVCIKKPFRGGRPPCNDDYRGRTISCTVACDKPAGFYPDPTNCENFLFCSGTRAPSLYRRCPRNTYFDSVTRECTHRHMANLSACDIRPDEEDLQEIPYC